MSIPEYSPSRGLAAVSDLGGRGDGQNRRDSQVTNGVPRLQNLRIPWAISIGQIWPTHPPRRATIGRPHGRFGPGRPRPIPPLHPP
eukprot:scaffold7215_cov366-Prasinococcus_capsulatus_cf.AAC.31